MRACVCMYAGRQPTEVAAQTHSHVSLRSGYTDPNAELQLGGGCPHLPVALCGGRF